MTAHSVQPRGTHFARLALAQAVANEDGPMGAAAFASRAWGASSLPAIILRAAVDAASTTGGGWASALAEYNVAAGDFIEALRPLTVIGKLAGVRHVPTRVRIARATGGSNAVWAGEAKPIIVSKMGLDTVLLDEFKLAGIVVATRELIKLSTPAAETVVRNDLLAAVAAMTDEALLDPNAAGVSQVSPASITNGAAQIASTGSSVAQITADLETLFQVLVDAGIKLTNPYFITTPRIAFKLAMKRDTSGALAFPGMGARGGEIGGVPVLVTGNVLETASGSPPEYEGSIILVDASEIILADGEEARVELTRQTSVQMNDSPDDPTTASTVQVSLWQNNLAAWRVIRPINWKLRRPGAVATLTGVNY